MRKARNPTTLCSSRVVRMPYVNAARPVSDDPDMLFTTVAGHVGTIKHLADLASILTGELMLGDRQWSESQARDRACAVVDAINIVAATLEGDAWALERRCADLSARAKRAKDEPNGADR